MQAIWKSGVVLEHLVGKAGRHIARGILVLTLMLTFAPHNYAYPQKWLSWDLPPSLEVSMLSQLIEPLSAHPF
jgi:hypothetical protein